MNGCIRFGSEAERWADTAHRMAQKLWTKFDRHGRWDVMEPEDYAMEALLEFLPKLESGEVKSNPMGYLWTSIKNLLIRDCDTERLMFTGAPTFDFPSRGLDSDLEANDFLNLLTARSLSRPMFVLRFFHLNKLDIEDDEDIAWASFCLSLSVHAIRKNLQRAFEEAGELAQLRSSDFASRRHTYCGCHCGALFQIPVMNGYASDSFDWYDDWNDEAWIDVPTCCDGVVHIPTNPEIDEYLDQAGSEIVTGVATMPPRKSFVQALIARAVHDLALGVEAFRITHSDANHKLHELLPEIGRFVRRSAEIFWTVGMDTFYWRSEYNSCAIETRLGGSKNHAERVKRASHRTGAARHCLPHADSLALEASVIESA
jgi:hypothetical protein